MTTITMDGSCVVGTARKGTNGEGWNTLSGVVSVGVLCNILVNLLLDKRDHRQCTNRHGARDSSHRWWRYWYSTTMMTVPIPPRPMPTPNQHRPLPRSAAWVDREKKKHLPSLLVACVAIANRPIVDAISLRQPQPCCCSVSRMIHSLLKSWQRNAMLPLCWTKTLRCPAVLMNQQSHYFRFSATQHVGFPYSKTSS